MMWKIWMQNEFDKPYFKALELFLNEASLSQTIYPPISQRYEAFNLTPVDKIKVVILGQDPYHGPNQAHGLSFSVRGDKRPPSLKNIYKELESDLNIPVSLSGDLTSWAKQGVLLLNTILTVEQSKPLSHEHKGWETFTTQMIKHINQLQQPIVFILWGNHARSYKKYLNNPNHLVIESVHPSPLSAYHGFFGSAPFSKTNQFLIDNLVNPIDWQIK